jgi:hypothetical protein
MEKINEFLLLALFSILVACGPTVEQAIKYNDEIISKSEEIKLKLNALLDSHDNFIPEQTDNVYQDALKSTKEGIEFLNKLEPFDKDTTLKAGALSLFKTYESVLEVEHKRLIELMKLPDNKYGDSEVAEYARTRDEAHKKVEYEIQKLLKVQQEFAKNHHFKVSEE